jgi:hypothetical protein
MYGTEVNTYRTDEKNYASFYQTVIQRCLQMNKFYFQQIIQN